jgi:hypothetical protein
MCVAFTTVVPGTSGLSVKPPPLAGANVALRACTEVIETLQAPVPVQAPFQPVNVDPVAGVAVKATMVPLANDARQVVPQEMPAGALLTVPLPVPDFVTVSAKEVVGNVNVAVTEVAALIVTVHVPVPAQPPPLQPVKVEPVAGVGVKVTTVPLVKACEQVAPQEMPAGALVTVPLPVPDFVTVSAKEVVGNVNVAVTEVAALIVTVHVPVPAQPPPLQPVNVDPAAGAAVRVTTVPLVKACEQVEPQEMPAGALVTVPLPFPDFVTVSVKDDCMKVAVTEVAAFIVTVQEPVPVQPPPLQPVKLEPAAAAAVSVTFVPFANEAEQVAPHEIPAGALVTMPLPAPALDTVNVEPVDTPVPVTSWDSVSPSAVKLTLVLAAAVLVGVNCTVTVAVAPDPTRMKGLPEAMLNGGPTEAAPVTVPPRMFWTVNVWAAELPMLTLPNATVPVGVTAKSTWATPLATAEHALSLPIVSTAVTATL